MSATMEKVLFTRIPTTLSRMLDVALRQRQKDNPEASISKSDLVREILHAGLIKKSRARKRAK